MSIGLVLEGGAMRGMYTAGVLDVFMENNINVDGVVGVSACVLFGVNYLSKQPGRVIRYNKRFLKDPRYMGLKSLIKTGNVINKDFSFYEVPFKLDVFDNDTYKASEIPFYATVSNIDTGKAEYIQLHDVFEQMELLRATSAMPYVSKIVEYDGKKYLDGGTTDSIPFKKCRELGYKKTIVVLTRPIDYRKKKSKFNLAKLKYGKYPKFVEALNNRYKVYNETVEEIIKLEKDESSKSDIFVIRPSRKIKMKRIEKNEDKLQEMYELGKSDANQILESLIDWMAR